MFKRQFRDHMHFSKNDASTIKTYDPTSMDSLLSTRCDVVIKLNWLATTMTDLKLLYQVRLLS